MTNVVVDRPYKFVPPYHPTGWSSFIQRFNLHGVQLRHKEGIDSYECRNVNLLRESVAAGHGVMLCPNHCRTSDPLVLGWLAREAGIHVFAMASWHLFNESRFRAWAIHKMGGFSLNREGIDRQAISTAIEILENAERPLILFPEGATSRTNDHLHALLDGVAFIARSAAKKRAKQNPSGKVVIHPIGLKYLFSGDLARVADEVLTDIETRLTWRPHHNLPLMQRLRKVGLALLALKEMEYLGAPQSGTLADRLRRMLDRLLGPLEAEWLGKPQTGPVLPRVKALRMKIMPEMTQNQVSPDERVRRMRQLEELQLAQQLNFYPPEYLVTRPSVDRILETLERFEEDMTGKARVHGHLKAIIDVAPAIEVSAERDRGAEVDPLMAALELALRHKIDELARESPEWN